MTTICFASGTFTKYPVTPLFQLKRFGMPREFDLGGLLHRPGLYSGESAVTVANENEISHRIKAHIIGVIERSTLLTSS